MNWSTQHLLAVIALLFAVFGGGLGMWPTADARLGSGLLVVSVILLSIALLVS
jgi:hypothetical protein